LKRCPNLKLLAAENNEAQDLLQAERKKMEEIAQDLPENIWQLLQAEKRKEKTGQQILCRENPYSQSAALNTS
jgi:hypothetical protein